MADLTLDDLFTFAYENIATGELKQRKVHPVNWIKDNFIDPITEKLVKLEVHQMRILRRALQQDELGRSKYSLIVWSEPKKSGKTTIASAVGAYVACNIESPNEISCVANDKEQAAGRIFENMIPTLREQGWKVPSEISTINSPKAYGPNGTIVKAITTRYQKEAGANQGLSLWSELWAYKGERLTRLWEEMTPPPTRLFSMRWVETYAGFIGENLLLQSIYRRVFKDFDIEKPEEERLQPGVVKLWPGLPVYELDQGRTLVYWSHEPRMPWQTKEYYISQRADLRSSSYDRLHRNMWVTGDESFITETMWENATRIPVEEGKAVFALDGSKNGDSTSLVGTRKVDDILHTVHVKLWQPSGGNEVPYKEIEDYIFNLYKEGKLHPPLWYDDYQLAYLAQNLRNRGLPCKEFSQGALRIKSDTFLYKLYKEGKILNVAHADLKLHVVGANVKFYSDDRIRIIKPGEDSQEHSTEANSNEKKVDAAVAQSMSAYKAHHTTMGGWGASAL